MVLKVSSVYLPIYLPYTVMTNNHDNQLFGQNKKKPGANVVFFILSFRFIHSLAIII